jgi:hypothetical protein
MALEHEAIDVPNTLNIQQGILQCKKFELSGHDWG